MPKLDQNSVVPIGLAVVVIGGGAVWMTRIEFQQEAQASQISKIDAKADTLGDAVTAALRKLDADMVEVKTHLLYLRKRR